MRISTLICRAAAAAISFALVACADPAEPEPDPEAAARIGQAEPLPSTLPPPSETTPRYVGLWATTAEGCSEPAWRFEANRISTRGEVSCEFQNVAMTERGYDIQVSVHRSSLAGTAHDPALIRRVRARHDDQRGALAIRNRIGVLLCSAVAVMGTSPC